MAFFFKPVNGKTIFNAFAQMCTCDFPNLHLRSRHRTLPRKKLHMLEFVALVDLQVWKPEDHVHQHGNDLSKSSGGMRVHI